MSTFSLAEMPVRLLNLCIRFDMGSITPIHRRHRACWAESDKNTANLHDGHELQAR